MSGDFGSFLGTAAGSRLMVETAKRAAGELGLEPNEVRHVAVVTNLLKASPPGLASIKTTRDRWFGFVPTLGGTHWKTLDDGMQHVLVCAVDKVKNPRALEVYLFSAKEVRDALAAAYQARMKAGHKIREDYGMWIALDVDDRSIPNAAGSGLGTKHGPVRSYSEEELRNMRSPNVDEAGERPPRDFTPAAPRTIADVLSAARASIATLSGVSIESIRLDLKIDYSTWAA